jgi:hypothetical protein
MAGVRYEGKAPDGDDGLVNRGWITDTALPAQAVTNEFINGEINRVVTTNNLQGKTYVDTQDGLVAKIADVNAADNLFLNASARGTTVASLDGTTSQGVGGMLITSQVDAATLVTDCIARSHVGVTAANFTASVTSNETTTRNKLLATVTIPDPGFPYHPLPFGFVAGQAGGTPGLYPWNGNGILGQLTVCPAAGSGDTIYGLGACGDTPSAALYPILPYAASNTTPTTRPATNGSLTLNLYGCCLQGNGYTFLAAGLSFYVIVIPAM